jgi:exonuclease-1
MGIEGLHPLLKSAIHRVDIKSSEFRGTTCAVDTSFLLHRGAYACAGKLAQNESTDRYIQYVTRYVERLLAWNIKPIMVFDGSPLPAKRITNINRSDERERNRLRAQKALASGKTREAEQFFQKAIEITPNMVLNVIRALRTMGIDVIVAPYEADAQLAYLNRTKIADYVITEDSDLVLFGCHHILFKLDEQGNGELFERTKFDLKKEFGLENFERFRWMCILSGCDYLDNISGIGLAKAKKIMSRTQVANIELILKQLPQNLGKLNLRITDEYITGFKRAHLAFLHQIVYDPIQRKQVPLNPLSDDVDYDLLKFSGQCDQTPLAFQHAIGNLNVKTKCSVDNFDPSQWKYRSPVSSSFTPAHLKSIWSKEYAVRSERFSLTSTPINTKTLSTPSPPRKIRPKSESSSSDALSTSDILNMYIPTSNEKKIDMTTKTTSSVEYHTSIIQSIDIVKRPLLFNQHDNDKSSRFFSSSTTTKSSVFDAINENQNISLNKEEISPNNNSNKRFKRLNTDQEEDSLLQSTIQSSMDTFLTPAKQNRIVLKRKSPNIEKELSSMDQSDVKTLEHENDDKQNDSNTETSDTSSILTIEVKSPVLELPQYLRNRFAKQSSSRMVRPT